MMGDHQASQPAADQLADQLEQLHLVPHVERGGWLVEHQGTRLLRQGAGDPDPLPLAARQRIDRPFRQVHDVAALERRAHRSSVHDPARPAVPAARNAPA